MELMCGAVCAFDFSGHGIKDYVRFARGGLLDERAAHTLCRVWGADAMNPEVSTGTFSLRKAR